MDFENVLIEISKLPLTDRLSFVQRVLDNIAGEMDDESAEFSPEFRSELARRIAADDAPQNSIPWEEVDAEAEAKSTPHDPVPLVE